MLELNTYTDKTHRSTSHPLYSHDNYHWQGDIEIQPPTDTFTYYTYVYNVYQGDTCVRQGCDGYAPLMPPFAAYYHLHDVWHLEALPHYFYRDFFSQLYTPKHPFAALPQTQGSVAYRCTLTAPPLITPGSYYALIGSTDGLGSWDIARALPLIQYAPNAWAVTLPDDRGWQGASYKYVQIHPKHPEEVIWEEGANRMMPTHLPILHGQSVYRMDDGCYRGTLPQWRGAGIVLPLFSIRTEHTMGVGDTTALYQLIAACSQLGMRMLQLLPINDTSATGTWHDSYPYNAISVFALHPMYLDIMKMGEIDDTEILQSYEADQASLNALESVDYEAVNQAKWHYIRWQFKRYGAQTLASEAYQAFYEAQQHWLFDYACFCHLRDKYGTADFRQWGRHATYCNSSIQAYIATSEQAHHEVQLHCFVQYHLYLQMTAVHTYAQQQGVLLKGDIPIGIRRDSDSAWVSPDLFCFEQQAGAPPDAFATDGQNWGFPTYHWPTHAKTCYRWWRARFSQLATYFDAYRIDHVLGFFRIWQIPQGQFSGLLGRFCPALGYSYSELISEGINCDIDRVISPYVTYAMLEDRLGSITQSVVDTFMLPVDEQGYTLAPPYRTQASIRTYLDSLPSHHALQAYSHQILQLCTEVMWIIDDQGLLHPRILVQQTCAYKLLDSTVQRALDRIYEDYYYHRNLDLWRTEAYEKLSAISQHTSMLPCAEDLGMVPQCVPQVLQALNILSLEIQTMPKAMGQTFAHPTDYPYLSVATFSTHDMPPLRNWWTAHPTLASRYYHEILHHEGIAPTYASIDNARQVMEQHLHSPSMLCLMSLQDWLACDGHLRTPDGTDEQINHPDNPNQYWQYRMPCTVAQLTESPSFATYVRQAIRQSHR